MVDPRVHPEQLLCIGRLFEINGDRVGAVVAYREVVLAGRQPAAEEARRRLRLIADGAMAPSR